MYDINFKRISLANVKYTVPPLIHITEKVLRYDGLLHKSTLKVKLERICLDWSSLYNQGWYLLRDIDKENEDLVKPVFVTEVLTVWKAIFNSQEPSLDDSDKQNILRRKICVVEY